MSEYEIEEREVTETKAYVGINGEEFKVGHVLDFLDMIAGTNGFTTYVRWNREYDDLAESLEADDIVARKVNGSWYEGDEEARRDLHRKIVSYYYDEGAYVDQYVEEQER